MERKTLPSVNSLWLHLHSGLSLVVKLEENGALRKKAKASSSAEQNSKRLPSPSKEEMTFWLHVLRQIMITFLFICFTSLYDLPYHTNLPEFLPVL